MLLLGYVAAGVGFGSGGFVGPFVGGWLFDVTGSYETAFAVAALAIAASGVAAWVAAPRFQHSFFPGNGGRVSRTQSAGSISASRTVSWRTRGGAGSNAWPR